MESEEDSLFEEELNAGLPHGEGPYTIKQLRLKMDNLGKRYRKERQLCTRTGSSSSKWPYYWLLHNFLGSLPMNDEQLVEESIEVPEVMETPEGAEVIGSWDPSQDENVAPQDDAATNTETSEETCLPCADTSGDASKSSIPHNASGGTRRVHKRPLTTAQLLLERMMEGYFQSKKTDK
ncbi:hypothetical protein MTO96_004563 [Rhipicephalus appendiculatus]